MPVLTPVLLLVSALLAGTEWQQSAPASPTQTNPPQAARPTPQTKDPKAPQGKATVELLTPPLDVTTTHGSAAMKFWLLLGGTVKDIRKIEALPAAADGRALPDRAVTVTIEPGSSPLGEKRLQAATLTVKADGITPNLKYTGVLVVDDIDRVPYSITDKTSVTLTSSPDKLSVTWLIWEPDTTRLLVRNSGTSSATITSGSVSLEDGGSKRRVEEAVTIWPASIANKQETSPVTIEAGQAAEVGLTLPRPWLAGTYAGTLALLAGDSRLLIPITVTTRGPALGGYVGAPFALFLFVLAAAIWLSSKLDAFFGDGGGLTQAETVAALGTLEIDLERTRAALDDLVRKQPPLMLATVLAHLSALRDALHTSRTVPNTPGIDTLLPEARAGQLAGRLLLTVLPPALTLIAGDRTALQQIDTKIGAHAWPTDDTTLKTFDQDVRQILDDAHKDVVTRAQTSIAALAASPTLAAAVTVPGPLVLPPGSPVTVSDALQQIRLMTMLQRFTIGLVTVLTAYQTFYAANAAFGTAIHYSAVFMWGLGFTQAGTQIVARARRPANG